MTSCKPNSLLKIPSHPQNTITLEYGWLCWVFVAARTFSSCGEQGLLFVEVLRLLYCGGFSCWEVPALGHSVFSSWSSQALEHRLNSCNTQTGNGAHVSCIGTRILYHWTTKEAPTHEFWWSWQILGLGRTSFCYFFLLLLKCNHRKW